MIIIKHRVNNVEDLMDLSEEYGVEIDLRSQKDELILQHDPFKPGVLFRDWLKHFNHNTLIINQKEEGLESKIAELLYKYKIENFFFLDQSIPFLIKNSTLLHQKSAARFSEYESVETVLMLLNHIKWVWLDCFTSIAFSSAEIQSLKSKGVKLCLVSPELQGRDAETEIMQLHESIDNPFGKNFQNLDAVCTKEIELWKSITK